MDQNNNNNFNNNYNQVQYSPPSQYNDINAPSSTSNYNNTKVQDQNTLGNNTNLEVGYNLNSLPLPLLMNNQSSANPLELQVLQTALRSNSQFVNCPYCRNQSNTRVTQQCSTASVLCCVCFGGIWWLVYQACRGKDINCYDADHHCQRCGNVLANYKAC